MKEGEPLPFKEQSEFLERFENERRKPVLVFFQKNWLGVLGIVLAIIGLFSSYYFYTLSEKNREPVIVETYNYRMLSPLTSNLFAIITKPDMQEISKNVYVHEVAFWNKGQLPIKKENILKKITFKYPKEVELIKVEITSSTRPDIINVSESHSKDNGEIVIGFDILEKDDGFKLQVIYASKTKAFFTVSGNIEGVSKFLDEKDLATENLWLGVGKTSLWGLLYVAGAVVFLGGMFAIMWAVDTYVPSYIGEKLFFIVVPLTFLLVVIFVFYLSVKTTAEKEARSSLPEMENIISAD